MEQNVPSNNGIRTCDFIWTSKLIYFHNFKEKYFLCNCKYKRLQLTIVTEIPFSWLKESKNIVFDLRLFSDFILAIKRCAKLKHLKIKKLLKILIK